VISLRGKILPVYDLATRLGVEHADVSEAKIVIVETAQDMAGVIVDDVEEVITIDAEQIGEAPSAGIGPTHPINGIAKIDDRLVVLLDPEGIVGAVAATVDASEDADELRTAA
jgi:purine-binding chemotaxis protein CheW